LKSEESIIYRYRPYLLFVHYKNAFDGFDGILKPTIFNIGLLREDFSSISCDQTGPETHPASYPMGTEGPFPEGKVAGV
jgi:hypothetical protein